MKALHDSCYMVPEQNPRVIKDSDPVKSLAWKQALERHEMSVAQQKSFNEGIMKTHYDRVVGDEKAVENEQALRKQKQKHFYEEIRSQMDQNVSGPSCPDSLSFTG